MVAPHDLSVLPASVIASALDRVARRAIRTNVDDCWRCGLAPNRRGGCPQVWVGGGAGLKVGAHRLACFHAHGAPPNADDEAAHSCGVPSCVNPGHLRWATRLQNDRDKAAHGTLGLGERNANAVLDAEAVARIRERRRGGTAQADLAREFGVARSTINDIDKGRTWAHLETP